MLLRAMPPRSSSPHDKQPAGCLAAMRAGISRLARLWPSRQASLSPASLSKATLMDIGLSPSDLPSIKSGRFFQDPTRKQR